MPDPALEALRTRLGADLDMLTAYDAAQLAVLDRAVAAAMATDDAAVEAGFEGSVRIVPRPLRGRARALLFPGGDRG